jgi:broad specificity phosphatase PhoE
VQTASPIVEALDCACVVSPLVFETGGMYAREGAGFTNRPGLSAAEIRSRFPGYSTAELRATGPWNGSAAKETMPEAIVRAAAAAQWIMTSKYAREMLARPAEQQGPIILVIHSTFIDLLLKALLNFPHDDSKGVLDVSNCSLTEVFLPSLLCTHQQGFATLKYLNRADHVPADL